MRSAGNFNPEWGYLAPAPSLMRTARIVAVATAIGATAGAGVVLSLIEHPAVESNNTAIAAHAIVTSVQAATPPALPRANAVVTAPAPSAPAQTQAAVPTQMPVKPQAVIANQPPPAPAINGQSGSDASAASPVSAPQSPPSVTALTESSPASEALPGETTDGTTAAPPEAPPEKKTAGKHKGYEKPKPYPSFDTVLRQLFTAQRGPTYYPR